MDSCNYGSQLYLSNDSSWSVINVFVHFPGILPVKDILFTSLAQLILFYLFLWTFLSHSKVDVLKKNRILLLDLAHHLTWRFKLLPPSCFTYSRFQILNREHRMIQMFLSSVLIYQRLKSTSIHRYKIIWQFDMI